MTHLDIISSNLFEAHHAATPFIKADEAREFYYNKVEELRAANYSSPRWTLEEYALRYAECEFISVVPFEFTCCLVS